MENENGELVIVEIQNTREADYFQRMLYGTAKVILEHITEGQPYSRVKKVYSVNIVYFDTVYLSHSIRSYSTALINLLSFQGHHTHDLERNRRPTDPWDIALTSLGLGVGYSACKIQRF